MVLPAQGIHAAASLEQVGIQGELVAGGGVVRDQVRTAYRDRGLLVGGNRVAAQLQQLRQPRVLLAKAFEFAQQRRG
jgi:hypothetical protein